jgi:peptidoglycan hydrolase-like protein with peptidoglycan-binding domain
MATVTRAEWGARSPRDTPTKIAKAKRTGVAFHHTTGSNLGRSDCIGWVRAIQAFHMDTNGWNDIGYQRLVCRHGNIFVGRGWDQIGAHATGHNTSHVSICAMGDLRRADNLTDALLAGLVDQYRDACAWAGRDLHPIGHGQLSGAATACPGLLTPWIAAGMPLAPDDAVPPPAPAPAAGKLVLASKPLILARASRPVTGGELYTETRRLQAELVWVHGLGSALGAIDGWAGPRTARAVRIFQERVGIRVDGAVGPQTWPRVLE